MQLAVTSRTKGTIKKQKIPIKNIPKKSRKGLVDEKTTAGANPRLCGLVGLTGFATDLFSALLLLICDLLTTRKLQIKILLKADSLDFVAMII